MENAELKIAVSSNDGHTVSGHAGQSKRWLIFQTNAEGTPTLVERLELPPKQVFHHFEGPGAHPLDGAAILITRFAGKGFQNKMRKRGIEVRQTREIDARKAVADCIAGRLAPPPSRRLMSMFCAVRDAFSKHA